MDLLHLIALALLQGLTEFLPISSSAHLILLPLLSGWKDQGLAFDVAVHVGTLLAVVIYFRRELSTMARDWTASVLRRKQVGESRLAWAVLWGTVPAGLAGLLFEDFIESALRSPLVIAVTTLVFGLLLGWADWRGRRRRTEQQLRWTDVLFIGVAQAIALIPGTSRSGITMTAGLMLGLTRQAAARFSFLLAVPILVLAGGLEVVELANDPATRDAVWGELLMGVAVAGIAAYLCIDWFLRLLDRIGMMPFVVYRVILGVVLLWLYAG